MSEIEDGVRIDIWLWRCRFFKTRNLATTVVSKGRIRVTSHDITRRISKPSALVRLGDVLTLSLNNRILRLQVLDPGSRRGPADEARTLYDLIEETDIIANPDNRRGSRTYRKGNSR